MSELADLLCQGSDRQLDPCVHPLIRAWDDPPKALQILNVLDLCIHDGLCSDFIVGVLETLYKQALKREGKTHADMEPLAAWRKTWG